MKGKVDEVLTQAVERLDKKMKKNNLFYTRNQSSVHVLELATGLEPVTGGLQSSGATN